MRARAGIALALLLAAAGCSGPVSDPNAPPAADDVEGWARVFPDNRWITAWGLSGSSARDAVQDAHAQVAARVRSSIKAETTSLARAVMRDEEVRDFQELVSEVTTTTTFAHAELIRTVDASTHVSGGTHKVLAVLDRHDLARALQDEYDTGATTWRSAAGSLDLAAGDPAAWTASWHRYREGFAEVVVGAAATRAATGRDPEGYRDDRRRWERAHAARDSVLQNLDLVLVLAPDPELDPAELAERLGAGLAHLGVTARGGACRPGDAVLRLEPRLTWTTVIGRVVSLELRGTIGPCDDAPWSEVVIDGSALRGDGRDPTADLLASMTPEALAPLLRESLGHVVPF